jgi:RNA polymerase sigma-70 factor (ECF subfamily)
MLEAKREYNFKIIESLSRTTEKALDDALVRDACAGDDSAFEQIFERHKKRIARVAGNFFNRREKIEDVVQEAFTKIFLALNDYSPQEGASFTAWISRIAINCCYDELRRTSRRPEDKTNSSADDETEWLNNSVLFSDDGRDVEAKVISRDLANKLLARLKPDDRLILTLMAVDEMSIVEIAKITDWSVAKVKVRAHRARASLRRILSEFI